MCLPLHVLRLPYTYAPVPARLRYAAEYVQSAVRAGLREYGISDHAPMQEEPFDDWRMKQADMGAYLDWIREATGTRRPARAGGEGRTGMRMVPGH